MAVVTWVCPASALPCPAASRSLLEPDAASNTVSQHELRLTEQAAPAPPEELSLLAVVRFAQQSVLSYLFTVSGSGVWLS